MKVGINATILDNKPTGLGIFTINIIKALANLASPEDKIIVYTSVPECFQNVNVQVKKVTHLVQPKYGKKAGILRFLWLQFIFPFLVKKDHCDVVYSTTHQGNLFINHKQVLTIHDLLAIKFPNQYKLQYLYFKYIIPHLLRISPLLFTVSENTKNDIIDYYQFNKEKISVVYNSIDNKHFIRKHDLIFTENFGDYILFLGASYPHKNVEKAIEAFLKYIDQGEKKINLLIVNKKNDYIESVKKNFRKNEAFNRNVKFLDYVTYQDLPYLYSNAEALLYPSLYEGFGIPPLEAMACGCPVIASKNSSLPEVCGNSAIYIDPHEEISIINGIKEILEDGSLKNDLSNRGLNQVKNFSWEKSAKIVYESLKKLAH